MLNTKTSSKPYVDIFLTYLPKLNGNVKEMVVSALSEKGNKKAAPDLIDIMKDPSGKSELNLWAVGNALRVIDDKISYNEIIDLCKNKKLDSSRQMMLGLLSRVKIEEAFKTLTKCLKETKLKGHAIEALRIFGEKKALGIIKIQMWSKANTNLKLSKLQLDDYKENNRSPITKRVSLV